MTVLIIEDHPITSMGLKMLIDENFEDAKVNIAPYAKEALAYVKKVNYDIILLDIGLPNTDTQSLLYNLKRYAENAKILVCSNYDESLYAMSYISMGASGFVHKSSSGPQIINAIKMLLDGQIYLSQDVLRNSLTSSNQEMLNNSNIGSHFKSRLSNRELEVLSHLLQGKRIKDISKVMNIHQTTASTLKKRIMTKANVDNLIDLKKKADTHDIK